MDATKRKKLHREMKHRNEYLICFKNIIYLLQMFAVFPFVRFNEATKLGRLLSITLAIISLTIYIIIIVREGKYLHRTYHILHREFSFINIPRFFLQLLVRFVLLTYPFLLWNKNKELRDYWENWMIFQIKFRKVTKTSINSTTTQYLIQGLLFLSTCGNTLTGMLLAIQQRKSIATNIFSVTYILLSIANLGTYWMFNNFFMAAVAKKITNLVQQALRKRNAVDLSHLIDLWIMLCDLNEQFIVSHSVMFLIVFSMVFICGILGIFTAFILFVYYSNERLAFTYIFGSSISIIGIMTFCESANLVVNHMVRKLKKQLLDEQLEMENKTLLKVIILFLHTIETRNPKVTFYGYMAIDRSILSSVLNTAINFLVVLIQFSPQYK